MIGQSGRIVIEIERDKKQALYEALAREGLTLKDWFLGRADEFLRNRHQLAMDFASDPDDLEKRRA